MDEARQPEVRPIRPPRAGRPARPRGRTTAMWAVVVSALLVGAATLVPSGAGAAPPGPPLPPRPAPPAQPPQPPMVPPSSFGPFQVGREVIQITSRTGRSRTVDVWYPVSPRATGPLSLYVGPDFSKLASTSRALDGVPVAKGGPFPLVVYSHGSGALRFIATFFTETLASHGFVVISADHTGDTVTDLFEGHPSLPEQEPETIASRAADVRMIVNGVLTRSNTRGDLLYRAVDPRRIGITGHSYGGLTAFATVAGRAADDGTAIPPDRRFKAIVTMDATPNLLAPDDLARIRVPTLSIAGEDLTPGGASFWYQTRARPFAELRIDRADHNVFTDICRYQELTADAPEVPPLVVAYIDSLANGACYPPHLGPDEVHLLTNRYAIAFLLRHLAGDRRYAGYLIPRHGTEFDLTYPDRTPTLPPVID